MREYRGSSSLVTGAGQSPVELWNTFRRETLEARKSALVSVHGLEVALLWRGQWRVLRRVAPLDLLGIWGRIQESAYDQS